MTVCTHFAETQPHVTTERCVMLDSESRHAHCRSATSFSKRYLEGPELQNKKSSRSFMQHCVCVSLQLVKLFNRLKWLHLFSQGERFVVHRILLYVFTSDKEFGCLYQAIDLFCGFV